MFFFSKSFTGHCISMLRQTTSNLNTSGHWHFFSLIILLICTTASILPVTQANPIFKSDQGHTKNVNNSRLSDRILASKPAWHNPCGLKHEKDSHHRNAPQFNLPQVQKPNDDDLMHGIVNMARMALRQSRYFKEDYVSTFHLFYLL